MIYRCLINVSLWQEWVFIFYINHDIWAKRWLVLFLSVTIIQHLVGELQLLIKKQQYSLTMHASHYELMTSYREEAASCGLVYYNFSKRGSQVTYIQEQQSLQREENGWMNWSMNVVNICHEHNIRCAVPATEPRVFRGHNLVRVRSNGKKQHKNSCTKPNYEHFLNVTK